MNYILKQFTIAKKYHRGKIILFDNDDFFELFKSDAILVSKILNLPLTEHSTTQIVMTGFPKSKAEYYMKKLLQGKHKIAIYQLKKQ